MRGRTIRCEICGRRHDTRRETPGVCARWIDRENETTQSWCSKAYLATIENRGVRGSYSSYLNKLGRLLGFGDRREVPWAAVDESSVKAVTSGLGKVTANLRTAWKALAAWCAAHVPAPRKRGRVKVVTPEPEPLPDGLVEVNGSLVFRATLKGERAVVAGVTNPEPATEFERILAGA